MKERARNDGEMIKTKRGRERQRQRDRDRQREREREGERERGRERGREREGERERGRQTGRRRERQTDGQTETDRETELMRVRERETLIKTVVPQHVVQSPVPSCRSVHGAYRYRTELWCSAECVCGSITARSMFPPLDGLGVHKDIKQTWFLYLLGRGPVYTVT